MAQCERMHERLYTCRRTASYPIVCVGPRWRRPTPGGSHAPVGDSTGRWLQDFCHYMCRWSGVGEGTAGEGNQKLCKQHDNKVASEYDGVWNVSEEHQRRGRCERVATNTGGSRKTQALRDTHTRAHTIYCEKSAHIQTHTKKLQGLFDLICLCWSSWKRRRSRQQLAASAWEETTGTGWPPFYFALLSLGNIRLVSLSICCRSLSPHWPASNTNPGLSPSLFISPPLLLFLGSSGGHDKRAVKSRRRRLWVGSRSKRTYTRVAVDTVVVGTRGELFMGIEAECCRIHCLCTSLWH